MNAPHRHHDDHDDHVDVVTVLRRGLPPRMPAAACLGNAALFDGNTPADIRQAITQCRTCPELTPCRTWAQTTPGLTGVIAGHHHTHEKDDDDQ